MLFDARIRTKYLLCSIVNQREDKSERAFVEITGEEYKFASSVHGLCAIILFNRRKYKTFCILWYYEFYINLDEF